ncbi:MAG TPA: thiamine phosphate synthase [Actinomycetota bacterium]|nr:thiamine phosphate synthase [Actinomycetota bacterium]
MNALDLSDAWLYLVAPARLAAGELAALVPELADAGVDLLQLREKEMEDGDLLREGVPIAEACRAAGLPFIVNDRPDLTLLLDADGVHVGQNDVPPEAARSLVGERIVGLSTHAPEQVDAAVAMGEGLDYIAVGPVNETPTKPGRPGTGLGLVSYAAERIDRPWFVTGGMAPDTLGPVLAAGGRRIVVVRAITESSDPPSAARRLKEMLLAAGE